MLVQIRQVQGLKHLTFHFGGKEYIIFDSLTYDEIRTITKMARDREKNLNPLNAKSTKRYFEDTDRMMATLLRRCFHLTDNQIAEMDQMELRSLGSAFIRFLVVANNL